MGLCLYIYLCKYANYNYIRYIDLDTYFKEWPGIIVEMGKLKSVGETDRPGTQAQLMLQF